MSSKRMAYYDPIASFRPEPKGDQKGRPALRLRIAMQKASKSRKQINRSLQQAYRAKKYQPSVWCAEDSPSIIPSDVLRRYRGECHVEGWGIGPTFKVLSSDGTTHHIVTRKSGKHYTVRRRLLFTTKERRRFQAKQQFHASATPSSHTHAAPVRAVEEPQRPGPIPSPILVAIVTNPESNPLDAPARDMERNPGDTELNPSRVTAKARGGSNADFVRDQGMRR